MMCQFIVACLALICAQIMTAEVPQPPNMVRQPPAEGVSFQVATGSDEKDKPFLLECEASGEPSPTYKWTKSGRRFDWQAYDNRVSQQQGHGTLVFTIPEDVDEGYYQCFATNDHGTSMSNGVFVRRADLSSFPEEKPKEVIVQEGEPKSLSCSPPTGFPKPEIYWVILSQSGSLKAINNSRMTVDPEGWLHFSNVTRDDNLDNAYYACAAYNSFREEYKIGNKVKLFVQSAGSSSVQTRHPPVQQYTSPPTIIALRGQELQIHCIYGGTPLPEIRWNKQSGGDFISGRTTIQNWGKTLILINVDFEDAGSYVCTASNGVGTAISYSVRVDVQSAPYWLAAPNNTVAAEDETVRFECRATGVPEPDIRWFVNGVPLDQAKDNPRRKLIGPNVMEIVRLEKSDTAVYQCNSTNAHGYAFADYFLNVLALPPEITTPPESIYEVADGQPVVIACSTFGAPRPEVKWIRDGRELSGGRYKTLQTGDLEIKAAIFADSGNYRCVASNRFGVASSDPAKGKLAVKERTQITWGPEDFEVSAGQMATFRCNSVSDSSLELEVDWYTNDQIIDFEQDPRMFKSADHALTISKTTELDSGTYSCVAHTRLDNVTTSATLIVQDRPNPPRLVDVECNQLMANVEWQPQGDNRAPILSFVIQYNTSFTPDSWEDAFSLVPAADFKFAVAMSPWANYTFRVKARNKVGLSEPGSQSKVCLTPADVPYKNPDNVEGRGTKPDNLVIRWTPMPMIEHNAPGFYYRVFWRRADIREDWNTQDITDWRMPYLIIPNTPTFRPYRIKVEAHNSLGQANIAPVEIQGWSGEDIPTESPSRVQVQTVVDADTAIVHWDPVSVDNLIGHFKGYKVQTWTEQETVHRIREMSVANNVTQAIVKMFVPFTKNFVRVLAFNSQYNGPPSEVTAFLMPEGKPGPVASLEVLPLGPTALFLVWKKPLEPNGVLTGYRIYYEEVDGTRLGPVIERDPPIFNPDVTRTKLAGLLPDMRYRVTVRPMTLAGPGVPYFVETVTKDLGPSAPERSGFLWSHYFSRAGKGAIKIIWLPHVDGSPGAHFYVEYKRRGETSFTKSREEYYSDTIILDGLESGTVYDVRIVDVDGPFYTVSDIEQIETEGSTLYAPRTFGYIATSFWFWGFFFAVVILIVLFFGVCVIKRNRGGKYSVHEKEVAQGREFEYDDGAFHEYTKPPGATNGIKGSRTSLDSASFKHGDVSDTESMVDYGEGKFQEDGSFIGEYAPGEASHQVRERFPRQTGSAMATFV